MTLVNGWVALPFYPFEKLYLWPCGVRFLTRYICFFILDKVFYLGYYRLKFLAVGLNICKKF